MPILPMMPSDASQVGTSMPGPMSAPPPTPGGPMGGGDLASLLAGGAPSQSTGAFDPISGAMRQFDQIAQMITDVARMFPGSEGAAMEVMEVLDRWRQQILITMTPQPSAMPGAETMM